MRLKYVDHRPSKRWVLGDAAVNPSVRQRCFERLKLLPAPYPICHHPRRRQERRSAECRVEIQEQLYVYNQRAFVKTGHASQLEQRHERVIRLIFRPVEHEDDLNRSLATIKPQVPITVLSGHEDRWNQRPSTD